VALNDSEKVSVILRMTRPSIFLRLSKRKANQKSANAARWSCLTKGLLYLLCVGLPLAVQARFEKLADLDAVSVSTEPNFVTNAGPQLLRTWILLDFKEEQRFEAAPGPTNAGPGLSYKSRKDYVQVDCRQNLYTELATQMFPEADGKGKTVFESTFHRSGQPRFATPRSHEGAVLVFLCRGIRPN
jgi:hypothetical protein